jgi:hypothetical protein
MVVHVFGEMGNIHALNPFVAAAACSSSDSGVTRRQPTEDSDDDHAVSTKESTETITTAGSLSPQSSIDTDAASYFLTPKVSSYMELHISPNSLIDFHVAEAVIGEDGILSETFVHNRIQKGLVIHCIYFLYGKIVQSHE